MRPLHSNRYGMFVLCLLALALSGCIGTSQPAHFYTLSSLRGPEPIPHSTSTSHGTIVAVGPVAIPDHLNRLEIITRAGQNEMRVNEFERWTGALDTGLLRAVIEDLSVLLPTDRFSVIRWSPAVQRDMLTAYRITADVMRFDAAPGGTVFLEADWVVYGKEKEVVLAKRSSVSRKVNGTEFTNLVAAMSGAVEDLCREIAAGMTSLEQKAPGK